MALASPLPSRCATHVPFSRSRQTPPHSPARKVPCLELVERPCPSATRSEITTYLSLDDRYLYVACWGTGCLKQFDVSDPLSPREIASVCIGGIATRAAHSPQVRALGGGPCTVTLSRDGRRVYFTNALSPAWDACLYPGGFQGWMVKLDVDLCSGLAFNPNFFVNFGEQGPQQMRLQGHGLE